MRRSVLCSPRVIGRSRPHTRQTHVRRTVLPCTVVPGTIVPIAGQKSQAEGRRKRTGVCGTDNSTARTNSIAEIAPPYSAALPLSRAGDETASARRGFSNVRCRQAELQKRRAELERARSRRIRVPINLRQERRTVALDELQAEALRDLLPRAGR